jgi:hypothetical protein
MADLFLFDKIENIIKQEGQCTIDPITGQTWAYLGTQWTPVTGGQPFTFQNPVTIFISGNLRNENIKHQSLKINNVLTNKIDTASFIFWDDGDSSIKPEVGEQVDIFEFKTNTKIFGGEISQITQTQEIPGNHTRFVYNISCTDYTKRLHKRLVTETYTNQKAGDIIKDIINTYFNEFSTINVADGPTLDSVQFNYVYADDAIKKIAKLSNYDWYVDYVKDVHFFLPATNYAPYSLTENVASSGHFKDLKITRDKTRYRNTIYLQAGYELTPVNDDIQVADGERTNFNLAFEPYSPVRAYVDTGSGFVEKTVGIDNIDTSGKDFVVNQTEKALKNLDLAKLNSGDILKVTYNKRVRLIVTDNDPTSISDIQAREGGDGVYEFKIQDDTIDTLDAARERTAAEINDYKDPIISGTFITDQFGYKAGQILQVNLPNWGYGSKEYKIQSVTIQPMTSFGVDNRAYLKITVKFATFEAGWNEFILGIYNQSSNKEIIVKGDEKLTT